MREYPWLDKDIRSC